MNILEYDQPSFYRFCHSSIILAQKAVSFIQSFSEKRGPSWQVLDLCSGCGVVGMEIQSRLQDFIDIDFFELQRDFESSICRNLNFFPSAGQHKMQFFWGNYADKFWQQKLSSHYHLIVSNPPFFVCEEGKLSKDRRKNICRYFLEASVEEFCHFVRLCLRSGGCFMFLARKETKAFDCIKRKIHTSPVNWNESPLSGGLVIVTTFFLDEK